MKVSQIVADKLRSAGSTQSIQVTASPIKRAGNLAVCFSVFLISLQSFYIGSLGGSLLCVLGATMLTILMVLWSRGERIRVPSWGMAYPIMILFFVFAFLLQDTIRYAGDPTTVKSNMGLSLFSLMSISWIPFAANRDLVTNAVRFCIYLHLLFFVIQVVVFFANGTYLDYLSIIGLESRPWSLKGLTVEGIGRIPRFTGLYNEPGTYSVHVATLGILLTTMERRLSLPAVVSLASSALTLSLFGVVLATFGFLVALFLKRRVSDSWITVSAISLVTLIFVISGAAESVHTRLYSDYSGLDGRENLIRLYFEGDAKDILFGVNPAAMANVTAVNDAGLWFWFVGNYGLLGWAYLAVICIFAGFAGGVGGFMLMLISMLTKLKATYPFFWLILVITVFSLRRSGARNMEVSHVCNDPVKTCSGDNCGNHHEFKDGRRQ